MNHFGLWLRMFGCEMYAHPLDSGKFVFIDLGHGNNTQPACVLNTCADQGLGCISALDTESALNDSFASK